jgi:putative dehydrogenase
MGGPISRQLLAAGFVVYGIDLDEGANSRFAQAGGRLGSSVRDVAASVDLLVIAVQDENQVEQLVFGANGVLGVMPAGTLVWNLSTVTPSYIRDLGCRLRAHGIDVIDGPVSGGVVKAETGELTVMAGCVGQAFERITPVFEACASKVFHVGDVGAGSMFKALNQLLTASHIALTAETIELATRAGLDAELLIEVIRLSAGNSVQFEKRASRMLHEDHVRHATVNLFRKDLDIVIGMAKDLGMELPVALAANTMFTRAANLGHGRDSDTRVRDAYRAFGQISGPALAS